MGNEKGIQKKDDYKRILRINESIGLEKKYERIEDFDHSFFRDNYYTAFALTEKVLARSQKMEQKGNTGQEKLYNIITFCGERGSGKTSVMDSIVGVLRDEPKGYREFVKNYEQSEKKGTKSEESGLKELLDTYEFICMDMIDASLLEEKEDILDVILSKMYQKVRMDPRKVNKCLLWETDQGETCSKDDIYRMFEGIDQNKRQFQRRMDKPYDTGESSVEKLSNLAGSMNIRERMQKLIVAYLELLGMNNKKNQYLVISIDDLDMHGNAYAMLEQLHRYLMIPKVIIYLTVSEREIQSVCKKHFEKIYEDSDELALSYLEKVLPYSRRIYLPATFSGDFFNVLAGESPDMEGYPVKRFLLREIVRKTWVFYDGCGWETHFYEIENLRTLINTYYLLDGMEDYGAEEVVQAGEKKLKEHLTTLDLNFEKLRNNVVGRMAAKKLDSGTSREIFRKYYKEDFSSNGEYLVREIAKITGGKVPNYNYGELLGSLDVLEKKCQELKPLIQCVLALATIELTQNYIYAFIEEDKNSQEKWNEYISDSVIGSWGNQMLPKIKGKEKVSDTAYVSKRPICISVPIDDIPQTLFKDSEKSISIKKKYKICDWLINKGEVVESVLLIMSFFTEKPLVFFEESKETNKILLKLSGAKCTFDFLGFAINGMYYDKFTEGIAENISQAMGAYVYPEDTDGKDDMINLFKEKIKERDVIKNSIKDEKSTGIALPIYSLDIMYNVLKRVKKKMEKKFPREIKKEELLPAIQSFYVYLGDCLIKEDMFYGRRDKKGSKVTMEEQYTRFYDAFLENPFVKYFVKEKKNEKAESVDTSQRTAEGQEPGTNQNSEMEEIIEKPGPTEERTDMFPELFRSLFDSLIGELTS